MYVYGRLRACAHVYAHVCICGQVPMVSLPLRLQRRRRRGSGGRRGGGGRRRGGRRRKYNSRAEGQKGRGEWVEVVERGWEESGGGKGGVTVQNGRTA